SAKLCERNIFGFIGIAFDLAFEDKIQNIIHGLIFVREISVIQLLHLLLYGIVKGNLAGYIILINIDGQLIVVAVVPLCSSFQGIQFQILFIIIGGYGINFHWSYAG